MHSEKIKNNAFSLVEVMVVLTIIAILVVMTVPSYQRAVEQSRADVAAANLRAIWAAQRLHWIEFHAYASSLQMLQSLGLIDAPEMLATTGYAFSIISADSNGFKAVALRTGSSLWNGRYSIDETGLISGVVKAQNEPEIIPGFQ
jgi:prepilin-type N-terminal cleavage/methylation domain-containing protein